MSRRWELMERITATTCLSRKENRTVTAVAMATAAAAKAAAKAAEAEPKAKRAPRRRAAAKNTAAPRAETPAGPAAEPPRDTPELEPLAALPAPAPTPADVIPANGEDSPEVPAAVPPEGEAPAPRRRGWWQKFN